MNTQKRRFPAQQRGAKPKNTGKVEPAKKQLSDADLQKIAEIMVNAATHEEAEKWKERYIAGFYGTPTKEP